MKITTCDCPHRLAHRLCNGPPLGGANQPVQPVTRPVGADTQGSQPVARPVTCGPDLRLAVRRGVYFYRDFTVMFPMQPVGFFGVVRHQPWIIDGNCRTRRQDRNRGSKRGCSLAVARIGGARARATVGIAKKQTASVHPRSGRRLRIMHHRRQGGNDFRRVVARVGHQLRIVQALKMQFPLYQLGKGGSIAAALRTARTWTLAAPSICLAHAINSTDGGRLSGRGVWTVADAQPRRFTFPLSLSFVSQARRQAAGSAGIAQARTRIRAAKPSAARLPALPGPATHQNTHQTARKPRQATEADGSGRLRNLSIAAFVSFQILQNRGRGHPFFAKPLPPAHTLQPFPDSENPLFFLVAGDFERLNGPSALVVRVGLPETISDCLNG